MKIDELVESISNLNSVEARKRSNSVCIYQQAEQFDNKWFLRVDFGAKSWECNPFNIDYDWACLGKVDPVDLGMALNIVDKFLDTPVSKRFPEERYVLSAIRYVEGPVPIKQYVIGTHCSGFSMGFDFGDKENAEKYTNKELKNLSQQFSKEVINAMKEPVEDE